MNVGDAAVRAPVQWGRETGSHRERHGGRGSCLRRGLGIAWMLALAGTLSGSPIKASAGAQPAVASTHATAPRPTVLVLGDSLSAGYGLGAGAGWVPLVAQRVARTHPGWGVVNASISGDTTDGGRARVVQAVVRQHPAVVVIELGANDGLRGLPLRQARINLAYMIGAAQGLRAKVLLVGMRLPPNYGPDYTREFAWMYQDLATRFHTAYLPFLLEPIARMPGAFQADDMHPVARVQPLIADHVWQALAPLLGPIESPPASRLP